MKHLFITIALFMSVVASANEINLLATALADKGKAPQGYCKLKDMLHPYESGYIWRMPKDKIYNRICIAGTKVKPMTRYKLVWELEPSHFLKMLLFSVFYDKQNKKKPPIHVMTFENSSAFFTVSKEIIVPANVSKLDLQVFLYPYNGINFKQNSNLGFIKSLKLIELGSVKFTAGLKNYYGKNLLPVSNFEAFSVGPKTLAELKLMPFNQKSFSREIVKDTDGRKFLRIHYRPGDYQYAAWFTPKLPLYGSAGTMRIRLRGKGRAKLMIWWNRPRFHTVYKHFDEFELPRDWKEYSIPIGCDDPLIQKAAAVVAFRDKKNDVVLEISDISFVFESPKGKE